MTRAELEAVIWKTAGALSALQVDQILNAADAYATGVRPSPGTQLPVTHWEKPGAIFKAACTGRRSGPVTADTGSVTCGSCRESGIWRKTFQAATR